MTGLRRQRRGPLRWIALGASLAGMTALAGWTWQRGRAIARVSPELRDPLMWLPLSINSKATLAVARRFFEQPKVPVAGVAVRQESVEADGVDIPVVVYEPEGRQVPGPALLWIHGGGTVLGSVEADHTLASALARDSGALVVSVDYRLAPEHPFPVPFDDCYAGLEWLHANAAALGVEPARIAVGGASAGGLLAASVCQRAVDEGVGVAFQLLVYPMLDDRTASRRDHDGRGVFGWTPTSNAWAWGAYLGHRAGAPEVAPYAVPSRREDLSGLPPTWIGVAELDLFYGEDLDYAARLRAAGVPVEVHVEPRMHHGADDELYDVSPLMRAWRARMARAVREGLGESGDKGVEPVIGGHRTG